MTSTRPWDRAADLPMVVGRRPRPEIAASRVAPAIDAEHRDRDGHRRVLGL
jgi:hypothetical protein